jgi:hypothetical protein
MQQAKKYTPRRDPVAADQHDAEKSRLEQKRGECLVAEQRPLQRPLDRSGLLGEHAPVGAELERHDDSRHDAHAERHREDFDPEVEQAPVDGVADREPHPFHCRQPCGQPDREGREDDVERHREGELESREQHNAGVHGSSSC